MITYLILSNCYYFNKCKWILLSCNSYDSMKVNFHKRGYKISDKKHVLGGRLRRLQFSVLVDEATYLIKTKGILKSLQDQHNCVVEYLLLQILLI